MDDEPVKKKKRKSEKGNLFVGHSVLFFFN